MSDATANHPDTHMLRLVRWLSGYALRRWPALIAVLGTMVARSIVEVLRPWPMLVLVDHILYGRPMPPVVARVVDWFPVLHTRDSLLRWTILSTIILFLLTWILTVIGAYANVLFSQRMVYDLAADLFSHLQRLSLGFHSRRHVGDTIRRVTTDCTCVSAIVKDAILPLISSLLTLVIMFVIMWRMDWHLTLLAMGVVPLMTLVLKLYARPMLDRSYRQQEIEGGIYDVVQQTLSAIPLVQTFSREAEGDRQLRKTTDQALDATLATTSLQLQFKVLIGLCTALGTAAILWVGARQALSGGITVGGILVFLSYLASLYGPLESVLYAPSNVQFAAGSARRVLEVLETRHEVREKPGAITVGRSRGEITFDNIVFGYEPNRPVLQGITLQVSPGQTIAIVGGTGAGKSSLAALVARFFDPWTGRVLLDGHDIKDVTLASLRAQVSLVLQDPFLFPLSISENIAYGVPQATPTQIQAAAEAADAHDLIMRLPNQYDTIIGERGATLSGGERQRLSIARALLRDAPILILDEPTSALDATTEASVLQAMRHLMQGRTTLMIAHRLSSVRDADRIIVLEHGNIIEDGTHADLLNRGGRYAALWQAMEGRQKS